jgi:hypothetical protein
VPVLFHVTTAVSVVTLCSDELNEKLRTVAKLMKIKYSKIKLRLIYRMLLRSKALSLTA